MASLVIREGNEVGKTFRLGTRSLTVGRGVANLIQVVDDAASRRHAALRWDGAHHQLQDLRSQNGVFVNEERVEKAQLSIGDRIRIGDTVLEVVTDDPGSSDATLERRVSDRDVVGKSTIPASHREGGSAGAEFVVDLDQAHATQEMSVVTTINKVRAYVERGEPAKVCYGKAIEGIQQCLAPDRVLVFELTPERKAVSAAAGHAPNLDPSRHRTAPHGDTLRKCLSGRAPAMENDIETTADALGSAAACPVPNLDGAPAAIVYVDSFADNRQPYLDDDLALLSGVADALRGLFARS